MKKWAALFVFSILLSPKGWGGELLELSDVEKATQSYSRIRNNIFDFIEENRPQINILNQQGFFKSTILDAAMCSSALEEIKSNQNSLFARAYGTQLPGIKKLKKDLLSVKSYFSSRTDKDSKSIVNGSKAILLILNYFGI